MATSHHRAEDAQPNEQVAYRRPSAPPQLVQVSGSQLPPQQQQQRSDATLSSAQRGRGGRNGSSYRGRDGQLKITKRRWQASGRGTTAGGWADAQASTQPGAPIASGGNSYSVAGGSNGGASRKGKEREHTSWDGSASFGAADRPPPPSSATARPSHPLPARPYFPPSAYANVPTGPSAASSYANTSAREAYGYSRAPQALATPIPVPANPTPKVPRLYVSHLPPGTTEQEVRSLFARYGSIYALTVTSPRPPTSFPSFIPVAPTHTYAHVEYDTFKGADAAIAALHETVFPSSASTSASTSSETPARRMQVEYSIKKTDRASKAPPPDEVPRASTSAQAISSGGGSTMSIERGGVTPALFNRPTPAPEQERRAKTEEVDELESDEEVVVAPAAASPVASTSTSRPNDRQAPRPRDPLPPPPTRPSPPSTRPPPAVRKPLAPPPIDQLVFSVWCGPLPEPALVPLKEGFQILYDLRDIVEEQALWGDHTEEETIRRTLVETKAGVAQRLGVMWVVQQPKALVEKKAIRLQIKRDKTGGVPRTDSSLQLHLPDTGTQIARPCRVAKLESLDCDTWSISYASGDLNELGKQLNPQKMRGFSAAQVEAARGQLEERWDVVDVQLSARLLRFKVVRKGQGSTSTAMVVGGAGDPDEEVDELMDDDEETLGDGNEDRDGIDLASAAFESPPVIETPVDPAPDPLPPSPAPQLDSPAIPPPPVARPSAAPAPVVAPPTPPAAASAPALPKPLHLASTSATSSGPALSSVPITSIPALPAAAAPPTTSSSATAANQQHAVPPTSTAPEDTAMFFDDDGGIVETVPLPDECRGESDAAKLARKMMRLMAVKKATSEGKVVVSTTWKVDALELTYELDSMPEEVVEEVVAQATAPVVAAPLAPAPVPVPTPAAASPPAAPAVAQQLSTVPAPPGTAVPAAPQDVDVEMEDVKPRLGIDSAAAEVEQHADGQVASPAPERPPVLFPFAINPPTAETMDIEHHVEAFIKEYFGRFDSSRAMLEYLYTPHAIFSVRVLTRPPARVRVSNPSPALFPKRFTSAQHKVSATPTSIVNAITHLPTGSHDLTKMTYDARELPELQARKGKAAPILLHLQGEFDEFPQHVVRSVYRTFVLVPKNASTGGAGCPLKYLVQSDQLVYGHYDPKAPTPLQVLPPPPVDLDIPPPAPSPPPFRHVEPTPQPPPQPQPRAVPRPRASVAPTPASAARLLPPSTPPARSAEKRARPAEASPPPTPAHDNHDDIIILSDSDDEHEEDAPPAPKRVNRRPSLEAPALPSATALGKRPAATPVTVARPRPSAIEGSASSSMARRVSNQAAHSSGAATSTSGEEDEEEIDDSEDDSAEVPAPISTSRRPAKGATVAAAVTVADNGVFMTSAQIEALIDKKLADKAREREKEGQKKEREKEKEQRRKKRAKEKAERMKAAIPLAPLSDDGGAPGAVAGPSGGSSSVKDARIVIPGGSSSVLHGFSGSTNKIRYMVDVGDALLGVSHCGDLVEWNPSAPSGTASSGVRKVHRAQTDLYRVDDFAYSPSKEIAIVPYLAAKDKSSPTNQVVLYKREKDSKGLSSWTPTPLKEEPHFRCGITALAVLPGDKTSRLRFVTAGEDKSLFLWTRSRSKGEVKTDPIAASHSSMITGLDYLSGRDWLVSGSKDKRLFAYDVELRQSVWSASLGAPINGVQAVPSAPHLFLAKMSTGNDQFSLFDTRTKSDTPSLTFGFRLPPKKSGGSGAPQLPALGRYLRGSFRDMQYAHPDNESGVKLWDLRKVKEDGQPRGQTMLGAGRTRTIQAMWRGQGEDQSMALLELANLTSIRIR